MGDSHGSSLTNDAGEHGDGERDVADDDDRGNADGEFVRGDAYGNVVRSFERVPVAVLYIVANIALGTHLFHGVWSLFQSMGWNNPKFKMWRKHIAIGIATIVVVGNVSFPIAVLAGIVGS